MELKRFFFAFVWSFALVACSASDQYCDTMGNCLERDDAASPSTTTNPTTTTSTTSQKLTAPAIKDSPLDVGEVKIAATPDTCNGVLLEPSMVLTSASCVYSDHKATVHENATFVLKGVTKEVETVYANPLWLMTGDRKANFALLKLARPMAYADAKHVTKMTWSPYALEDIGESFLGMPIPTSCQTASKKTQNTDTIRHVGDSIVTVTCTDRGKAAPGSPFFRRVDGIPVVYGVYFGHCTSGSLDRKTSGSCGSRISKQVFTDFCNIAKKEHIDLPGCDSKLLKVLHSNLPTTVFTKDGYDTIADTKENEKAAVFVFYSSLSPRYEELVNDIESIQRLKSVYDKFQLAIVDVDVLPFQLKYVPYIEYRLKSESTYFYVKGKYDLETFRKFMDTFGRNGAPPPETTNFLLNVRLLKRDTIAENPKLQQVKSQIAGGAGDQSVKTTCDKNGYEIRDKAGSVACECLPGYFGNGKSGNCQDLEKVLSANCRYEMDEDKRVRTRLDILSLAKQQTWCAQAKYIFVQLVGLKDEVSVAGKKLTPLYCAQEIENNVACVKTQGKTQPKPSSLSYGYQNSTFDHAFRTWITSRRGVISTTQVPSSSYLTSFLDNIPPGPISYPPNTIFIHNNLEATQKDSPFSILFNGNRGIPEYTGYRLTNAQMKALNVQKVLVVNKFVTIADKDKTSFGQTRVGKDELYQNRGDKRFPEGVEEGQLNPSQIHSYNKDTMKATHTHVNAYPQFTDFRDGVWKTYEKEIFNYAKDRCQKKSTGSKFYLLSGVSDYEIKGGGRSAVLSAPVYWPVAYEGADPKPLGSQPVPNNANSIVQPKSMWTVGCCTWQDKGAPKAEAVSVWANNKPKGVPKSAVQPDLKSMARGLYPANSCFSFFPANPECVKPSNHFTLDLTRK